MWSVQFNTFSTRLIRVWHFKSYSKRFVGPQTISSECQNRIEGLKSIAAENKTAVMVNEVDAIQSRCISVQSSAAQQVSRLQRLLSNWTDLTERTRKVEEKLDRPLLSTHNQTVLTEDSLEKELLEHKVRVQILKWYVVTLTGVDLNGNLLQYER